MRAASGSVSMPMSRARGHRRPAASRNRADPVPGSTTWPGPVSPACRAAHPIMLATTGAGVSVWPSCLRSAAVLAALSASPSGSPPAAIAARIASSGGAGPVLPAAAAAAASSRSAADRAATRSAPSPSAALTSAGRSPADPRAIPGPRRLLALAPATVTVTALFLVAALVPVTGPSCRPPRGGQTRHVAKS